MPKSAKPKKVKQPKVVKKAVFVVDGKEITYGFKVVGECFGYKEYAPAYRIENGIKVILP